MTRPPLRRRFKESPHQLIARVHLAEGNLDQAVRTLRLYQRVVMNEPAPGPGDPPPPATLTDLKHWPTGTWP